MSTIELVSAPRALLPACARAADDALPQAVVVHERRTSPVAPPALPQSDGRAHPRHRQLRPRRRRHQRPPAPALRLRLRLDRQAHRHPRTPPRPAAPGHQRPVPRGGPALHRQRRRQARATSTCSSWPPSRPTCRSPRPPAWSRTGSSCRCAAIEVEAACAGFMYALITGAAYVVSGASDTGPDRRRRLQLAHPQPERHQDLPAVRRRGRGRPADARPARTRGCSASASAPTARGGDLLSRPAGGSRMPPTPELLDKGLHYMHMDGRAVFRWAVRHPVRHHPGRARREPA